MQNEWTRQGKRHESGSRPTERNREEMCPVEFRSVGDTPHSTDCLVRCNLDSVLSSCVCFEREYRFHLHDHVMQLDAALSGESPELHLYDTLRVLLDQRRVHVMASHSRSIKHTLR